MSLENMRKQLQRLERQSERDEARLRSGKISYGNPSSVSTKMDQELRDLALRRRRLSSVAQQSRPWRDPHAGETREQQIQRYKGMLAKMEPNSYVHKLLSASLASLTNPKRAMHIRGQATYFRHEETE